jgi:hypothetical protein
MDYNEKRKQKKERLKKAIQNSEKKIEGLYSRQDEISRAIPFGQPILIGHHSEKRHRRDIERLNGYTRKSIEEQEKKEYFENKLEAMENSNIISSDDPEAIQKLKDKLLKLQIYQEKMKDWNKSARKDNTLEKIPDYALRNNNQNINSIKKRINSLESKRNDVTKVIDEDLNKGIKIIDNVEENRLQIIFDEKPEELIRSKLKSYGFKYSYYNNAWQRFRSRMAVDLAKSILKCILKSKKNN